MRKLMRKVIQIITILLKIKAKKNKASPPSNRYPLW
jgi:hypothetical protein